jgi:hypothetical protein
MALFFCQLHPQPSGCEAQHHQNPKQRQVIHGGTSWAISYHIRRRDARTDCFFGKIADSGLIFPGNVV